MKKTSKHSRSISKKSGRKGRGNSQPKKLKKDKNLTIELSSLSQSTQQNLNSNGNSKTRENKAHNISNNNASTNKASRYNQLIGSSNPILLYQTHQSLPNKAKFSGPISPKDPNQIQLFSKNCIIKKDNNDPY